MYAVVSQGGKQHIDLQNVIEVKDLDNIYDLPVVYKKQNLDKTIFNLLDIIGKELVLVVRTVKVCQLGLVSQQ